MTKLSSPVIISRDVTPPSSTQLLVEQAYKSVLFRVPDRAGFDYWVSQIESGHIQANQLETIFKASEEGQRVNQDLSIVGLYDVILNRAPDIAGFEAWSQALKSGNLTLVDIARAMAQSAEGNTLYSSYSDTRTNMDIAARNFSMTPLGPSTQSAIEKLITQGNDFAQIITKFVVGSSEGAIETVYEKLLTQNYKHQYAFYKGYGFFDIFVPINNDTTDNENPLTFTAQSVVTVNGTTGNDNINITAKTGSYLINGLEGNDVIDGSSGGYNTVVGGPGNDVIKAYKNDTIFPGWDFKQNPNIGLHHSGGDGVTINGPGTFYQSSGYWSRGPGGDDFVNYNVVGEGKLTFLPVENGAGRTNIAYETCNTWGAADASGWRYSDDKIELWQRDDQAVNQLAFRDTDYYVIKEGQATGLNLISFTASSDFWNRTITGGSGIYFEQGNLRDYAVVINMYNSLFYTTAFGIGAGNVPWNLKPNTEFSTVDAPGEWGFFYTGGEGSGDTRDAHLRYFDTLFNETVDIYFPSDGFGDLVRDGFANNDVNGMTVSATKDWISIFD